MSITVEALLSSSDYPKKVILEKLLCHRLSMTKTDLFTKHNQKVAHEDEERIKKGYYAYTVNKEPLEYIIGHVTFAGLDFFVNKHTLIPRPETEYMIEAVNEWITDEKKALQILDIGTGCGVLGLSVLRHNTAHIEKVYLSDLSKDALNVAQKNYTKHFGGGERDSSIAFLSANLLKHPQLHAALQSGKETILVANLPYIPEQLFEDNTDDGVKKREPKMAFVGGKDGLDLYRIMFDQLLALDTPTSPTLFLEMMTRQVDILRQEYPGTFSFEEVKTFHFNIRIVRATLL